MAGITDIEAGVKGFANGKEVSFVRADMTDKHNISVPDDIAEAIKQANSDGLGASVLLENPPQ